MHIMDDDSNRSTVVDETPRTNGTHKTRRKSLSAEGEKDSDSGKENGPSPDSDKEKTAGKDPVCESSPGQTTEKEFEHKDVKEEGLQEKKEAVKETNIAESTNSTMMPEPTTTYSSKDNDKRKTTEATSTNNNTDEDEGKCNENTECTSATELNEPKLEMEENKIDDNCSLPLSPADEDDMSRASSPVNHQNDCKQQNEQRRKRGSSESDQDSPPIVKKIKMTSSELEERERMVSEYIESASGTSLDEIQRVAEKLQQEITTLNTLARAKEQEWNNIIRVKKIKEETLLRVQRKKEVLLIMMGSPSKSGENDWEMPYEMRGGESILEDLSARTKILEMNCGSVIKPIIKSASKSHNSVLNSQLPSTTTGVSILKSGQNQLPVMMVPVVSSNAGNLHSSLNISSTSSGNTTVTRVPESTSKDKINNRSHRPILPKPTIVLPSTNATNAANSSVQNPVIGEGRQGPILDVRSIIADYRSKHPGDVPRRGRRLKSALSPTATAQVTDSLVSSTRVSGAGGILSMASVALGSGSQVRPGLVGSTSEMPDLGFLLSNTTEGSRQESSRPSSADSSRSGAPAQINSESGNITAGGTVGGISFKDVLVQFAKLSQTEQRHEQAVPTTTTASKPVPAPAPYPEVTLHPVLASHSPPHQSPSSSLLHGILTKSTTMQQQRVESSSARPTTFSPTLARLLTAPERIPGNVPNTTVTPFHGTGGPVSITDLLSTSKTRNEITITPVAAQQTLKAKEEVVLLEEEQEDSADRLVIDESVDGDTRRDGEDEQGTSQDISPDEVPECQGCHQRPAQFVCAGCGNQWYCSRDCQVSAWDEHSEVCSG